MTQQQKSERPDTHCLVAEVETQNTFRCTRAAGHEGPCAAVRVREGKAQEIRHRRPGPKYMTRSNDLATITEAHLIAEHVLREYRRKKLWRRVFRALVIRPLSFLAGR